MHIGYAMSHLVKSDSQDISIIQKMHKVFRQVRLVKEIRASRNRLSMQMIVGGGGEEFAESV